MLYLASRSPRRSELLQQIGVPFRQIDVDVDETVQPQEAAADYVCRVAQMKAKAGLAQCEDRAAVVLGADTAVVIDQDILGKPQSESQGIAMLQRLSGQSHQVLSAVALCSDQQMAVQLASTRVDFRTLSDEEIRAYWRTGEPQDKAGGYGIQGLGAVFVAQIQGNYSTVVGLPLFELSQLLGRFSIAGWQQV